jgi:hypothetical protein
VPATIVARAEEALDRRHELRAVIVDAVPVQRRNARRMVEEALAG